jgi:hypothetical protein
MGDTYTIAYFLGEILNRHRKIDRAILVGYL